MAYGHDGYSPLWWGSYSKGEVEAAGPIASTVTKQRVMKVGTQLAFSVLFSPCQLSLPTSDNLVCKAFIATATHLLVPDATK